MLKTKPQEVNKVELLVVLAFVIVQYNKSETSSQWHF